MAADYMFAEDAGAASGRFEKFLKIFIVLTGLFLGGELVWLVGISPFRPFSRIDISGSQPGAFGSAEPYSPAESSGYFGLSRDEIFAAAGITGKSSYFSTDVKALEKALAGISSVESARVFKHFPDKLQIVLEGRQAVASALAVLDDRTVPVLFDGQGVVFRIGAELGGEPQPHLLPVISGIVIENPFPGMRLPVMLVPLFKELEKIEMSAPELLAAVSELRINRKSFDTFDLILYPAHKKIKVRIPELNEDLLRYTLLMVDVLASKESGIESLDFRSGIASYIPKEASSE